MDPLFSSPVPATYPISRESTTTIRVWTGGGRSKRGTNTALRQENRHQEGQLYIYSIYIRGCVKTSRSVQWSLPSEHMSMSMCIS